MNQFTYSALRWLEFILQERFGYSFSVCEEGDALLLSLQGIQGNIRFDNLQAVFHQSRSDFPCTQWQASAEGYKAPIEDTIPAPSEWELPAPLIEVDEQGATIHYDILGLTYWMLTRLEEVGRTDLDNHQRFPGISSHAYKHDYLERPIVDEWLDILGQVLKHQWPELKLKLHQFSMIISHDVDQPSRYGFQNLKGLIRTIGGDALKRRDFKNALLAPWIWLNSTTEVHPLDPANTFDWLMDVSEENGLTSAFYFICGRTDPDKDAHYEPEHPAIRSLMRKIHMRGHEIGLHPSYKTYRNPDAIAHEAARLKKVCDEESIHQSQWGGRMHFLRWAQPITLNAWAEAGMDYDSSLGYADRPGFRCGTCFEYPAFDPTSGQQLSLRIRPLIAMECTIIADKYLGLGSTESAYEKFHELRMGCQAVGGQFTLLWHNSFFLAQQDYNLYRKIVHLP